MNKKLALFFNEQGLKVSKNHAYGEIDGYEVNVDYSLLDTISPVKLHFSGYIDGKSKTNIHYKLRNEKLKFFRYEFTTYGLVIGLNDITIGALIKKLPTILSMITRLLNENEVKGNGYCPFTGEEIDVNVSKKYLIDGFEITMNISSMNEVTKAIEISNQEFASMPNNYLLGFAGALIGGIAGFLVSFLLYSLGYISSISAFVSVLLGVYLYKKFKGKENYVMIITVALVTIAFMMLSVLVTYLGAAVSMSVEENLGLIGFDAFNYYMGDPEFSRYFRQDILFTLLFTALGIGIQISYLARSIRRKSI